jgi:glycosyltransferase involved in cell wall biosynthesis
LRVAHIITRLIVGGAQENTLLTVRGQQQDYGDDVTLLTGPGLGPEGSLGDRARAEGLRVVVVPELRRSIHPLRDWQSYRRLVQRLQELRPEIVHTHSSKAGILGRLAARRLGIPCVHTIHGAAFHYGQGRLAYQTYRAAERCAAPWTARFISVSDDMTAEYVRAGIAPADRFVTIYSGFDVEPFLAPPTPPAETRRRLGLSPDAIVVGKIARLFHLKGHEFLLRAAPAIAAAAPRVRFLLVGDGLLRPEIEREIARLGLADRFIFTGLVPPEQIPELMHAMDIVVHTSQWEGLARVLPQGLISGKPVVAYDVGGAREVVLPGQTGCLLPRDSVAELAEAVVALAGDPVLRARLGRCGRERFTDMFRHQTMTRRIRDVYREVLAKPGG